jgi:hypothetical protein
LSDDIFDHPDLRDPAWAGKVKREMRRSYWRRNRKRFVVLAAVVSLVTVAVAYLVGREKSLPAAAQMQTETAATTPTSVTNRAKVDLKQPFVGTPAADWSDGEAGLVMPVATEMNGFPATKVSDALTKARQAFIEAHLDRRVLQDNNVEPLAAVFAPDVQQAIRTDSGYHTRIKPGFRLLDVPPKVNGKLTVGPGKPGELVVDAKYVVAYAFYTDKPEDLVDEMDIVSVIRIDQQYTFHDGPPYEPGKWGVWPGKGDSYWYSIGCEAAKEGLLAPAYSEPRLDIPGARHLDRSTMFDPENPVSAENNCPQ